MIFYLKVTVDDQKLNETLDRLLSASETPIDSFGLGDPLHSDFLEMEVDWFASSGKGSWPDLADSTVERKFEEGISGGPLRFTDRLFESLTKEGAPDQIFEVAPERVRFGSTVPYSGFHMEEKGSRPARPPVPRQVPEENLLKMGRTIVTHVREYVTDLGFLTVRAPG